MLPFGECNEENRPCNHQNKRNGKARIMAMARAWYNMEGCRLVSYHADNPRTTTLTGASGRILILSLWAYDANKRHICRADCVALNAMAEEICTALNRFT